MSRAGRSSGVLKTGRHITENGYCHQSNCYTLVNCYKLDSAISNCLRLRGIPAEDKADETDLDDFKQLTLFHLITLLSPTSWLPLSLLLLQFQVLQSYPQIILSTMLQLLLLQSFRSKSRMLSLLRPALL